MKKTLLLGLGLLGGMTMMAQDMGTDVTPAGYKFGTTPVIPWYDNGVGDPGYGFCTKWNFSTSSRNAKGVWENLGSEAIEYWNANQGLIGCAGGDAATEDGMNKILAGYQLVDLGGEVGQVLCWQGKFSNLREQLEENYPQVSWDKIPEPLSESVTGWNLNFWLNPTDIWTKGMGYYRFRMVVNALHNIPEEQIDEAAGLLPFNGDDVFTDLYQVNNQGNNTSFIYDGTVNEEGEKVNTGTNDVGVIPHVTNNLFVKRTPSGGIMENEWGDPIWDPTKWVVVDYYFNVAGGEDGLDANGDTTTPVRIKLGTVLEQKLNYLAVLIKEISITKFEGDLTQEIYDLNQQSFPEVTLTPGVVDAGVEGIIDDVNAPVEFYNLQGVKVTNPENGIFIRKQGNKATKVIL